MNTGFDGSVVDQPVSNGHQARLPDLLHPAISTNIPSANFGGERDARRSCIAASHKTWLRIAQPLALRLKLMDAMVSSQLHRNRLFPSGPSHLKGPRFSDGPIFLVVQRHPSSLCGTRRDRHFGHQAFDVIRPRRHRSLPTKV